MGSLHSIEEHAIARLRAQLGAAEEDKQDLIAFARGHRGAVDAIHSAVLLAIQAADIGELNQTVVHAWPTVLGIDHCALALPGDPIATLATANGTAPLDRVILRRALSDLVPVTLRDVGRGNVLFGPVSEHIRAEALIRIELRAQSVGLLLLGQGRSPGLREYGGSELLRFLGQSLGAIIGRWRDQAAV